jgi:hypothetical protein
MRDLAGREGSGRSRLKLRASHRSLQFRVSHHQPEPWQPPAKDRDDDEPARGASADKKRR